MSQDKIVGLTQSSWGGARTALIYEDGAIHDNGYCVEGSSIESISNQGENAIVISRDDWGNRYTSVIRLRDGALIGSGRG
jgi:hypothetical protein